MLRIAIVDDSPVARIHIARALGDGVEVVNFMSAMGFVDALLQKGLEVAGVVTDLWIDGIGENWTGALVVRACHRLQIPVVVATAQESGRDAIAKSLGCPVLQKPVDGQQLRAALGI